MTLNETNHVQGFGIDLLQLSSVKDLSQQQLQMGPMKTALNQIV